MYAQSTWPEIFSHTMSTPARPTAPVRQGIQLEHVLKELEGMFAAHAV